MKISECLAQLPDDLRMIDLLAFGSDKVKTVAELRVIYGGGRDDAGYEVRTGRRNYGKDTVVSIGVIGGPNLFNQA